MRAVLLFCFLMALWALPVRAQHTFEQERLAENATADSLPLSRSSKEASTLAIPVAFFQPETSFAFGGLMVNLLRFGQNDSSVRTSNVKTALIYTLRNQFVFSSDHTLFLNQEKIMLRGNVAFLRFPDTFYGIGNQTLKKDAEIFSSNAFNFTTRAFYQVAPSVFAGFMYNYLNMYNIRGEVGRTIESGELRGSKGLINSGGGLVTVLDTRDNVLNAYKGTYAEFTLRFYTPAIGSTYRFNQFDFDLRHYVSLAPRHLLALHGVAEFRTGDVPFQNLALLGGDRIMRGYFRGRFRDNKLLAAQAEYRWQALRWLGFTGFVGAGEVQEDFRHFSIGQLKPSWGGGVRVMIDQKERLNLRIDYGRGVGGAQGFYVGVAEAF